MAHSKPHVIISAAISIDGKIATTTGDSKLSSADDLRRLHKLRSKVDAIIIGKNTLLCDDPLLTVRHVAGKNPIRVILDSKGQISVDSKILQTCFKVPTIIAVSEKIPQANLQKLKKFPVDIIITGQNSVNLKSLLKKLETKKIHRILVEGGSIVNWEFIKLGLFDELYITICPFLIGGENSVSLVGGSGFAKISKSPKLRLESTRRLKNHLVLNYRKV